MAVESTRITGTAPTSSSKRPLLTGLGKPLRGEEGKGGWRSEGECGRRMDGDHRGERKEETQWEPPVLWGKDVRKKDQEERIREKFWSPEPNYVTAFPQHGSRHQTCKILGRVS